MANLLWLTALSYSATFYEVSSSVGKIDVSQFYMSLSVTGSFFVQVSNFQKLFNPFPGAADYSRFGGYVLSKITAPALNKL